MNRTQAPTAAAEQRLREHIDEAISVWGVATYLSVNQEGPAKAGERVWLAIDAYRDFIRVCAVAEVWADQGCTESQSLDVDAECPKGTDDDDDPYRCDHCEATSEAEVERDLIATAVLEKR